MPDTWEPPPTDEPVTAIAWDGISDHDEAGLREPGPVPDGPVVATIPEDVTLQQVAQMVARISTVYPDQLMTGLELLGAKLNVIGRNQEKLAGRLDELAAKVEAYEEVLPDPGTLAARIVGRMGRRRVSAPPLPASRPAPSPVVAGPAAPSLPLAMRAPARAVPHHALLPEERSGDASQA